MAEKNAQVEAASARAERCVRAATLAGAEKCVRAATLAGAERCAPPVVPDAPPAPPVVPDESYMRMALDEARAAAEEGEVPIGSVVVCGGERVELADGAWGIRGGEVVARAHNRRETDRDPSAHAEFAAMCAAARALDRWRLTGCTVYVTLEPCLMCAGLMVNARVDRCVFGASDPKGGALGTLYDVSHDERLNHEFEVDPGVLADECADELRRFFRARRRSWRGQG